MTYDEEHLLQLIAVGFILIVCFGLVGRYVYRIVTQKKNPCDNCQGCALKGKITDRKQCPEHGQSPKVSKSLSYF